MSSDTNIGQVRDKFGNVTTLNCHIRVYLKFRGKTWTAFSHSLRVAGFSTENEEEALKDFDATIKLFFQYHADRGTLEETLRSFGWKKEHNVYNQPGHSNVSLELLGAKSYVDRRIPVHN